MLLLWAFLVLIVHDANASAQFSVIFSPPSLKFSGRIKTLQNQLKEIFCASLGLSVDEDTEWKGLYVLDPFRTPEAAVNVDIEGISSLGYQPDLKSTSFPLDIDEYEPEIYEAVKYRIKQKFAQGGNKFVDVKLCKRNEFTTREFEDVFGVTIVPKISKQPLKYLKYFTEVDYQFLNELQALKVITNRVSSGTIVPDHIVDFYNFRFCSVHDLSDHHGPNSFQVFEAKNLLSNALQKLSKAFVKAYNGSVFVTAIVTEVTHSHRHARSPVARSNVTEISLNATTALVLARTPNYTARSNQIDEDFPVIFNILLWFGLAYTFTLIAIVYVLIDMDPGRDSIIYRMTNTRMKKDL